MWQQNYSDKRIVNVLEIEECSFLLSMLLAGVQQTLHFICNQSFIMNGLAAIEELVRSIGE